MDPRSELLTAGVAEAETVVLLGCLDAEPAEAAALLADLREEDFTLYGEACRAVRTLIAHGQPLTRFAVRRQLVEYNQPEIWDSLKRADDEWKVVTGGQIRAALHELRLSASRRRGRRVLRQLEADLDGPDFSPDAWRARAGSLLGSLGLSARGKAVHVRDLLLQLGRDLDEGASTKDHVPSPWPSLNQATKGLGPGQLHLLAARPSMGKTAMATQIARHAAKDPRPGAVVVFSFEMPGEAIARRVAAQVRSVPIAELSSADARAVAEQALALWVFDLPQRLPAFPGTFEAVKLQVGAIKLVVIDYLGQLAKSNNYEDVSAVSRELLDLAKREHIPVLALHQLSRAVEQRPSKEPLLSDLRDSGQLEQDAHGVWMLFRPGYYDKGKPATDASLFIRKNRDGKTGAVRLHWRAETTSFHEPAPQGHAQ